MYDPSQLDKKTKKPKEAETKITFDAAVEYQKDALVGFEASHDTAELKDLAFGASYKLDGNKFWAGYDYKNSFARVGAQFALEPDNIGKITEALEVRWNLDSTTEPK